LNANIVIGTPGKVKSMLHRGDIKLTSLRLFAFDEADKLYEDGQLKDQVDEITTKFPLPSRCQFLGLSATYTESLKERLMVTMNEYIYLNADADASKTDIPDTKLEGVLQYCVVLPAVTNPRATLQAKIRVASQIIKLCPYTQCMMFCSNRRRTDEAAKLFREEHRKKGGDFLIQKLSGTMEQNQREEALLNLRSGDAKITIATDLAARGIDASGVDLVIHIDGASDWRTHQHRVGRGGRLGSFAVSVAVFVENLNWDVQLRQELEENTIEMTHLPIDASNKKLLPFPSKMVDHILNSGRTVFSKPAPVARMTQVSSEKPGMSTPTLGLDDLLEKWDFDEEKRVQKRERERQRRMNAQQSTNVTEFQNVLHTFSQIFETISAMPIHKS